MIFWEKMKELFRVLEVMPPPVGTPFLACGTEVEAALKKVIALTEVAKAAQHYVDGVAALKEALEKLHDR